MSSSDLAPLIGANFGPGSGGFRGLADGLAGAEPVGLGAGLEDVGVEGEPVDDRGGEAGVGEHGSPFAERQVGRDRDRGSFLPLGDDLEQQLGAAGIELDVAELVETAAGPAGRSGRRRGTSCALVGGFGELVDEARRR